MPTQIDRSTLVRLPAMSLYTISKDDSGWVVRLTDHIDPLNMSSALEQISKQVAAQPPARVRLCLDDVAQIQSSAAGRLVELKRRLDTLGVALSITGVQPTVREMLTCMKLDQVLPLTGDKAPPDAGADSIAVPPAPLAATNTPKVVRLKHGFGKQRTGDQLQRQLAGARGPLMIFNFSEVKSLDEADVRELIALVELVESKGGRCAAARMRVEMFETFVQTGLGGRLMLYPEVARARVGLLAATGQ